MNVVHDLAHWRSQRRPLYVAIGFFDGVHRGHARLIQAAVRLARRHQGEAWVLTFDLHPARILQPSAAPRLLTEQPQKLQALAALGVDGVMVVPFTRALAQLPPQRFLTLLRAGAPTLTHLFVGPNWRFGKNRAGTVDTLCRFARQHHIAVSVARPARHRGDIISSTRVRSALANGDLTGVTAMLGRPFGFKGTVVRGTRLGHKLGYPTANLQPGSAALPPFGIYAVMARADRQLLPAVVSYGVRPTIASDSDPVIELHIFDFDKNLYGKAVEILFVRRLRDEKAFATLAALKSQIARDVRRARRILQGLKLWERIPLHSGKRHTIVRPEHNKERRKNREGSSAA
ncbi:MAG: bifunctional riboflavin kinase/FAD synthetase [Verrucomicrobia bacterium]|nr:bifunctional riboflavin kinase/FAD synthetase [Verrucomicrobiota bacterium]